MSTRDEFFWLTEINKATLVINEEQGLLPTAIAKKAAQAVATQESKGAEDAGCRPKTYITYEPKLIGLAGPEITLMHAGRSSQDIHATYRAAIVRDGLFEINSSLLKVLKTLTGLAQKHQTTVVPNYTNGVAAQPTSYSHYLLGFISAFGRDATRIQEYYKRLNQCPMGSTVLNGTPWPLNRDKMAAYLGFDGIAYNAFDATQILQSDIPVELAALVQSMAIHVTSFLEDLMVQYAQPRPWILLQEGGENTYVSSAMPQKRNPGLVNNCRTEASQAIGEAQAVLFRAHNLQTGMIDPKRQDLNKALATRCSSMLNMFDRVLRALVINPARALEELNNDWTASQEVADTLMHEYDIPFRVGHHVASAMVSYARARDIKPLDFPYPQMQQIFKEVIEKEFPEGNPVLPMSEEQFRLCLNPHSIVENRKTKGSPNSQEMKIMLDMAESGNQQVEEWLARRQLDVTESLARLDKEFLQKFF